MLRAEAAGHDATIREMDSCAEPRDDGQDCEWCHDERAKWATIRDALLAVAAGLENER